jgi:hypothetical protein
MSVRDSAEAFYFQPRIKGTGFSLYINATESAGFSP